jgi:hypothetical protein
MAKRNWKEVSRLVWRDQWEEILAILAIVTTFSTQQLPAWLAIVWLLVAVALARSVVLAARQTYKTIREKHVPVIVLVGKGRDVADAMWGDVLRVMERSPWHFHPDQYRKDFNLERSDYFLHQEEPLPKDDPEAWLRLARRFRQRIEQLSRTLPGRRVFHIFLNGPITMALGLGAAIGTMFEVVVHQYFPASGELPYHPVIDFYTLSATNPRGAHFLEDAVSDDLKYIQVEGDPSDARELYVSLWMAKDDPKPAVDELVRRRLQEGAQSLAALHIRQKEQRSLETTDDWLRSAREILTALFREISSREQVHLFLSAPIALAFALGMGLEHFLKIRVYSWWMPERTYYPALDLERLGRIT